MAKVTASLKLYNRFVKEKALELKKKGFRVRANIRGFLKPGKVGSYKFIPDIVAVKDKLTQVYEVENPIPLRQCNDRVFFHRLRTIIDYYKDQKGRFVHYMLPLISDDMKGHYHQEESYIFQEYRNGSKIASDK